MSNDKLAEALRDPAEKFVAALEKDAKRIGGEWETVLNAAAQCIRALLQAHAAEAVQACAQTKDSPERQVDMLMARTVLREVAVPHPQPAQDAKLPSDEDFRLHLGELTSAELRIARAAFRFAMAKESGR